MSLPNRPYNPVPKINPEYFRQRNRNPLPTNTGRSSYTYPTDLITGDRDMYMQIEFVKYEKRSVFRAPFLSPLGGVALPIPKKINDQQAVIWEAVDASVIMSALTLGKAGAEAGGGIAGTGGTVAGGILGGAAGAAAAGLLNAGGTAAGIIGSFAGLAPNPFLTMLFKSGQFKEHSLNWTFTPHNPQESQNLVDIIQYFKFNMLPSEAFGGLLLRYPNIAIIRLYPNDFFTYRFKPCAIASVNVDYSGAGQPSFFENGAPTVINFSLQLKEIELWMQEDFGGNW
jgi:hypothetical protein